MKELAGLLCALASCASAFGTDLEIAVTETGQGAGAAPPPSDVLARWEGLSNTTGPEEVMFCFEQVRTARARGDVEAVDRLVGIARAESQSEYSRALALTLACTLADDIASTTILDYLDSRLALLVRFHAQENGDTMEDVFAASRQVNAFVAGGGAKALAETVENHERFLLLLASIYARGMIAPEGWEGVVALITGSKAPLASRRAAALHIVELVRSSTDLPLEIVDLIDVSQFPQLRQLVRASAKPREFHFAAAAVLSYHGDVQIVDDLEMVEEGFRQDPEQKNLARYIDKYLWRIEVQNPPTKLLKAIAAVEPDTQRWTSPDWAIRRAQKLGLEPARIRAAILQRNADASTRDERMWLPAMKRVGLELGILVPSDLPDVMVVPDDVVTR